MQLFCEWHHYSWGCALTAIPTSVAHCGQGAGLFPEGPCRIQGRASDCSLPLLRMVSEVGWLAVRPLEVSPVCEPYEGPPSWVDPCVRDPRDGWSTSMWGWEKYGWRMREGRLCAWSAWVRFPQGRAVWRSGHHGWVCALTAMPMSLALWNGSQGWWGSL